ncbi:prefoldin subunit alpha [uncultured Methanobrevibacter sp.]|uniref:prefoldin subunit alpha n=1 Tax=uncultured Methanobrevibacter sp. TaxID=253161 RepID=UPI0025ED7FE4|nr:prefoldin subunit alpha [uncultured Methanobrevibacter sp.]
MEDQQKLQQILAQLEVYKQQTELYQTQIDAVQASLAEIKILESTLDDMSGKDTIETLVPLGAGSFINAEIKNEDKVIMSLGSGVAVSKTFEEAKATTAEQKKELENTLDKLFEDLQQITNIVAQLSPQAEQLMQKLQAQGMA